MSSGTIRPGLRFGPYEVLALIGSGTFGTVYEALRHPLRKRVALKVLNADMALNAEALVRFLREAETASALQHPHIVDVQDLGSVDGVPFMAMEFLIGETLEDRLDRDGRLSVEASVDLMLPIISAVAAVHAAGVVHRDLKPANIFIAQGPHGDHPKLLDFGIVKVKSPGAGLTHAASVLGTPSFMSPEQVREARDTDARSDVWSLAAVLYSCVVGEVPFGGASMFETFDRILGAPLVLPGRRVPGVPREFDAVLARAMARDPAERTASVRDFGRALLPFASQMAQVTWARDFHQPAAVVRRRPAVSQNYVRTLDERGAIASPPRRSVGARALAAAVGVATLVFGGLLALQDDPPTLPRASLTMRAPVVPTTVVAREAGTSDRPMEDVQVASPEPRRVALPEPPPVERRRSRRRPAVIGNY